MYTESFPRKGPNAKPGIQSINIPHISTPINKSHKYKKRDRTRCCHNTTSAFLRNANCSSSDTFASNPGRCAVQNSR